MAVKLRLARHGGKKKPYYRIVAADIRMPRDGRYIEHVGVYDPTTTPTTVRMKPARINYWLSVGAQFSDTVGKLLKTHLPTAEANQATHELSDSDAVWVQGPANSPAGQFVKGAPANQIQEVTILPAPAPVEAKADEEAPAEEAAAEEAPAPVEAKAAEEAPVEAKAAEEAPAEEAPAPVEAKAAEEAPVEAKAAEEAPAEEAAEEAPAEVAAEEAPAEVAAEEAPAEEAPAEEAPAEEAPAEEAPAEEAAEEAPAKEAPAKETKDD
jgi:ribosomal protein S16